MDGLERRIAAGLSPDVRSASRRCSCLPVGQGDHAQAARRVSRSSRKASGGRKNRLYAYRDLAIPIAGSVSKRRRARATIAVCEHGHSDPAAPDTLYIGALAAPNTVNTMPEETLLAFA